MPRDSNGNYVVPGLVNPVVAGTTITDTWANTTMADLATGVTDSLDRNGRGGMLQPLRVVDGALSAPGVTFSNESNTGIFRPASNVLGFSIAGTERMRISASGPSVSGRLLGWQGLPVRPNNEGFWVPDEVRVIVDPNPFGPYPPLLLPAASAGTVYYVHLGRSSAPGVSYNLAPISGVVMVWAGDGTTRATIGVALGAFGVIWYRSNTEAVVFGFGLTPGL